jgi:hypothetical protein
MRAALHAATVLALIATGTAQSRPAAARHVVLVTIDGLRGDYIAAADP